MGSTTFSGPVTSTNGFVGNVTGNISGSITATSPLVVGSTSISEAEIGRLDGVTAGVAAAGKAMVLDSNKEIATIEAITVGAINIGADGLTLDGNTLGATMVEVDGRCDETALLDVRTGAGAISPDTSYTALVTTGENALTLAAPTKTGFIKTIRMATDGGDGTLASTNIVGQSSGTTSITFNDVEDILVLVSDAATHKWIVLKEIGVTAA
jgi:hypothetical protein